MRGECGTARPLRPRLLPGGRAGQAVGGAAAGSPASPPRSPAQPQPRLQLQHLQVRGFKSKTVHNTKFSGRFTSVYFTTKQNKYITARSSCPSTFGSWRWRWAGRPSTSTSSTARPPRPTSGTQSSQFRPLYCNALCTVTSAVREAARTGPGRHHCPALPRGNTGDSRPQVRTFPSGCKNRNGNL